MRKLALLLLILTTACASGAQETAPASDLGAVAEAPASQVSSQAWFTGLQPDKLGAYHATFLMHFEGDTEWTYRLDTRSDGQAVEQALHMEGMAGADGLGDIRLVTREGVSRMHGPGTEGECVQFPSHLDLGPVFLTPNDLLDPARISSVLTRGELETTATGEARRYQAAAPALENWVNAQIELLWDEQTETVLLYDLRMSGTDPLFKAGPGRLTARYMVNERGPQVIEPVPGCDFDLPIPDTARDLIKLPGLVAFQSAAGIPDLVAYYQQTLPDAGWQPMGDPLQGTNATLLSYQRAEESLQVNIETQGERVTVELLLDRGF